LITVIGRPRRHSLIPTRHRQDNKNSLALIRLFRQSIIRFRFATIVFPALRLALKFAPYDAAAGS
jgi:hypothetical protein